MSDIPVSLTTPPEDWGAKVIERLARDLRKAWLHAEFVQGVLAQLRWFHLYTLLDKFKDRNIFEQRNLNQAATVKESLTVQTEGTEP